MPICRRDDKSEHYHAFGPGWYQGMPDTEKKLFKAVAFWARWFVARAGSKVILPEFCETLKSLLLNVELEHRTPLHMALCRSLDDMIADVDFVRMQGSDRFNQRMFEYFRSLEEMLPEEARTLLTDIRKAKDW